MKEFKNSLGIIRIAGLSQRVFSKFNETNSDLYTLSLELIDLENRFHETINKLEVMLYTEVKYNPNLLKLKRKVSHNKNININEYNIKSFNLKNKLNDYIILRNLIIEKNKKLHIKNQIEDEEVHKLIEIYLENKSFIDRAIIISSKDFYFSIERNLDKWRKNKKIDQKFLITLYKYLIRASYKTSPFSFYCLQGIIGGRTTSKKSIYEISSCGYATLSLMNIGIKNEKFKLNKDIWINSDNIEILKKSKNNYRNLMKNNRRSLVAIEYNQNIEKLIEKIKNKNIEHNELLKLIQQLFEVGEEDGKKLLMMLCDIGIIENSIYSSEIIDSHPKILEQVNLVKNRIDTSKKFNNNLYEEVFLEENIKFSLVKPIDTMMLNKIMIIFDDSIIMKNQFIEYIGKNITMNINELIKVLKDFYKNKNNLSNFEIDLIKNTRKILIDHIIDNFNKEEIFLDEDYINALYKKVKPTMSDLYSYTYFYQCDKNLVVLNKVFSGFTRMFNKFENVKADVRENSEDILKSNNKVQYLDLYSIYGFNANVRPLKTDKIIDLENIWNMNSLKELKITIDYTNKIIKFTINNTLVKPINLGATSSRMFPLIHSFICDINHADTISFDTHLINRIGKIKSFIIIPRIRVKNIILSRKKWVINTKNISNSTYDNIIKFIIEKGIPSKFYAKPIKSRKINNIAQMNDYFKPHFINIRSSISYQVFNKILKNCDLLLIEEAIPLYDESFKSKSFYEGHLYEVGVESYFTEMENDKNC